MLCLMQVSAAFWTVHPQKTLNVLDKLKVISNPMQSML